MKKHLLILAVSALLLITNNAYSQYDLTLATQTVNDCANSARDGALKTNGLFTISPTGCQRIELKINQKDSRRLKIYPGTDDSGIPIYNSTDVGIVDLTTIVNSVTIKFDHNSDPAGDEYLITWKGLIDISATPTNINCFGGNTGAINVTVSGGTPTYTYDWSTADGTGLSTGTEDQSGLTIGTYTVSVTDANSCISNSLDVLITQLDEIIPNISQTKISCSGANDGQAMVAPTGGSGSYTYLWDNSKGTASTATGLNPTINYKVTVTDATHTSCAANSNITVTENPTILPNISQTKISCSGANDGQAMVAPTGGSGSYTYLWDNSKGTAATATGLNPTINYKVTVTDATHTSCAANANITVTENPTILPNISQTKISCSGANDGQAMVAPTGGSGSYTYLWDNSKGTAATATGLNPTINYKVTVTDATHTSCAANANITVNENPAINPNISQTKISCSGANDGQAMVAPTGGSGSYTYLWDNSKGTAATATGLNPTINYKVTVTDATHTSCAANSNITVTENPTILPNISQTKISCSGANDGQAMVAPTGGSGSYTYLWDNSKGTAATATGLNPTINYKVTVTDATHTSCAANANITVTENPTILPNISQTKISCSGANDGQAMVAPTGGSGSYTYLWDNSKGTAATATGLNPTINYKVTVTDATHTSCAANANITVNENPAINPNISQTKISCSGANDGQAMVAPTGGSGSYTYLWDNSKGTAATATGLNPSINYKVTVTDATHTSCAANANITVTENPTILPNISQTKISCSGANDGQAMVAPTGGSGSYTYLWDNSKGTAANATGLNPTINYKVTVTDATNTSCTANANITVTENPAINPNISQTKISCSGANDGQAMVAPTGGSGSYTYLWDNSKGTAANATGLNPTINYKVTVTDATHTSCAANANITVTENPAINPNISQTKISCSGANDGQAMVAPTGGSGSYTYLWDNSKGTAATATGLNPSINYKVTVTDATHTSCAANANINVTENPALVSNISKTNVSCLGANDGQAVVAPTGGSSSYNYYWDNGNTTATATNLTPVLHNVTITDALHLSCTKSDNITISEPSAIIVSLDSPPTNIDCNGANTGAINISSSGGNTRVYTWSTSNGSGLVAGSEDQTSLTAGTYTVFVSDNKGCSPATMNVLLTEPAPITAVLASKTDINCIGGNTGAININSSGGNTKSYAWSGPSSFSASTEDISGLISETYSLTVTDNKSCPPATLNVLLSQPGSAISLGAPTLSNYNTFGVSCYGATNGHITANPTGGTFPYTYMWSPNTNVGTGAQTTVKAIGLSANIDYTLTVTDNNGCSINNIGTPYKLTEPGILAINQDALTNVSFKGGSDGAIDISVTNNAGSTTYNWVGANTNATAQDQNGLPAGYYTVTVTDANTCSKSRSFPITEPNALNAGIIAIGGQNSDYVCPGENTFTIQQTTASSGGSGSYTYSWQYSNDNATWTTILSATSINLTWVNTIAQDTYIRRVTSDGAIQSNSNSVLLDFIPKATLAISNLKTEYCANGEITTLLGTPTNSLGQFLGNGIISNNNGVAQFDPTVAAKFPNPISITYRYTENGCTTDSVQTTTIRPIPNPSFTLPAKISTATTSYTINDESPAGGIFSGNGVTPAGTLYLEGLPLGNAYVYYKVTNEFGCSNTDTASTVIVSGTGLFYADAAHTIELGDLYCFDDKPVDVYVKAFNNNVAGAFESPITNVSFQKGLLTPSAYTGSANNRYIIKYNYSGSEGKFSIEKEIKVYNVTEVAVIKNLNNIYCNYGQIINISANPLANNDVGVFSGNGITDNDDATAKFNISAAAPNSPTQVKYLYKHDLSGCKDSVIQTVTINPAPVASFDSDLLFNQTDAIYKFQNIKPYGGIFEGEGVSRADSTFNPATAKLYDNLVQYSVTNIYSCKDTTTKTLRVEKPTGEILNVGNIYCYDDSEKIFSVVGITNPTGVIGTFSGFGITDNGDNTALFNPKEAWDSKKLNPKKDTTVLVNITFTYKGTDGNTEFQLTKSTLVRNNGQVTFTNLNDAKAYCANATPFTLKAQPLFGQFSGIAMEDSVFHPENALGNPTTIVRYTYTDKTAGCTIFKNEVITILKVDTLKINYSDAICANISSDTISGFPKGGKITTNLPIVPIVNGLFDSVVYIPNPQFVGLNTITYEYTNPTTLCSNAISEEIRIHPIPVVDIQLPNNDSLFCEDDAPINLQGLSNNTLVQSGIFTGKGIVNESLNTGKGIYSPKLAGTDIPTTTIKFNYTDANGCQNSTLQNMSVNELPDASMVGYDDAYCSDYTAPITINGYPQSESGIGTFQINNSVTTNVFDTTIYISNSADKESIILTYTFVDENGCIDSEKDTIIVLKTPVFDFLPNDLCTADTIQFDYSSEIVDSLVKSYLWNFGDDSISTEQNPKHYYHIEKDTEYDVSLMVELKNSCDAQLIKPYVFQKNTTALFDWKNECYNVNEPIQFLNLNQDAESYDYHWDFGDDSSSTEHSPKHLYNDTGDYTVTYTLKSSSDNSSCTDINTKTIYIRPTIQITDLDDYTQSFENGTGGWIPETLQEDTVGYSWEWGIPSGGIINTAADGYNAYVTGLSNLYKSNENSAVTSPCFDISGLERPMISLSTFRRIENRDGAVMEYSVDGGNNWNIVGSAKKGINWYNAENISVRPGSEQGEGWTDTTRNWVVSKIDLDENGLFGQKNVRFRIAFASDNYTNYDGFAFDNIQIGNRTRKVLIEHFSNYENSSSLQSDATIDEIRENKPEDAIDILYESSISVNNKFYNEYPLGVNARESYYNINSVPFTYFDGNSSFSHSNSNKPTDDDLMKSALINPEFDIDLSVTKTNEELAISTHITSLNEITNRQLKIFTAIVEQNVSFNPGNGTIILQNVLRRFLPAPSGEYIKDIWEPGESQQFNYTYIPNSYVSDPKNLIVITFIQDELTKEILQAADNDSTTNASVSIEEWFANTESLDMLIFPNPAADETYLVFSEKPSANSFVEILNQQGKVIKHIKPDDEQQLRVELDNIVQGIYFVKWVNNEKQVIKKLIITQ